MDAKKIQLIVIGVSMLGITGAVGSIFLFSSKKAEPEVKEAAVVETSRPSPIVVIEASTPEPIATGSASPVAKATPYLKKVTQKVGNQVVTKYVYVTPVPNSNSGSSSNSSATATPASTANAAVQGAATSIPVATKTPAPTVAASVKAAATATPVPTPTPNIFNQPGPTIPGGGGLATNPPFDWGNNPGL